MKNKKRVVLVILLLLLSLLPLVASQQIQETNGSQVQENQKTTTSDLVFSQDLSEQAKDVYSLLLKAEESIFEMQQAGIATRRYNDTLLQAEFTYTSQVALEQEQKETDYSLAKERIAELQELRRKAFLTLDELNALGLTIEQIQGIDKEPVQTLYQQATTEFNSERYDSSLRLIESTYQKISEQEALQTKVRVFYDATSRTIGGFLARWWLELLIVVIVLTVFILLSHNSITILIIKNRIKSLESRRNSIYKLIQVAQKDFFEKGTVGESTYRIKIRKYGELIRDVNRKITLQGEKLAFCQKKKGLNTLFHSLSDKRTSKKSSAKTKKRSLKKRGK